MAQQDGHAAAVVRPHAVPDTRTGRDLEIAQQEWLVKGGAYPCFRALQPGVVADVREDDRELVAAEARDAVFIPRRRLESQRDLAQQLVADFVPVAVVDLLEVVQIDIQQTEPTGLHRPRACARCAA